MPPNTLTSLWHHFCVPLYLRKDCTNPTRGFGAKGVHGPVEARRPYDGPSFASSNQLLVCQIGGQVISASLLFPIEAPTSIHHAADRCLARNYHPPMSTLR